MGSMNRKCGYCGQAINLLRSHARFCSSRCRVYAHRHRIPGALTSRPRWVRRTTNKHPITVESKPASSTDPDTWATYKAARESSAGAGVGFVLNGDGIGCIDLDHCLIDGTPTEAAARFIARYPGAYIEVSPSGDGLHIWTRAVSAPGTRRTEGGLHVERYSRGRYITVTGNVFQKGEL